MGQFVYSSSTKGFYPSDEEGQQPYIEAGSLPDDLVEISDEKYNEFFGPPEGYYSVFDEQGPRIEKIPEPDYVAIAEAQRESLLAEVQTATYTLNAKLNLGRKLSADEAAKFNAWLDYSDALEALDLSSAPDIEWPEKPSL